MSAEAMRAVHEAAQRAAMSAGSINDLPDSDFAYIEPGGKKDASGKTVPRSKRHFPIHDAAHVRNALARAPQSPFGAKAMPKIRAAAKKFGIQVGDQSNSAQPLAIDVVRDVCQPQEWRAVDTGDGLGVMSGHFSVFDTWYPVESKFEGRFLERVDRSAFDQTIADDRDGMRVLFDHGFDPQIGNKVLGPIRTLEPDQRGAYYEVPLFDTTYNRDLLPGLRAGVYGASMRMRVHDEHWDDKPTRSAANPDGIAERTITRASVAEFGAVTFPASPGASAGVRSATDRFYDQLRHRDSATFEAAVRSAGLVDFGGVAAARSSARIDRPERANRTTRQRLDEGQLRLRGILK